MDKVVIWMYISVMRSDDQPWDVAVLRAARTRCPPGWHWHNPAGRQQAINWWLVEAGSCELHSHGEVLHLQAGDCIYQNLYTDIVARNTGDSAYVVSWFDLRLLNNSGQCITGDACYALLPRRFRQLQHTGFLQQLIERCILAFQQDQIQTAGRWARSFIDEIAYREHLSPQHASAEQPGHIRLLCDQIRLDSAVGWNIARMAAQLSCSKDHFARLFKSETGSTPSTFLNQVRIHAAQELLLRGDSDVSAIAGELGFYDVYHFSKRFKQHTGLSPTAWRQQHH